MNRCGLDEDQVIALYRELRSTNKVAAIVGSNYETIRRILVRNNVPRGFTDEERREKRNKKQRVYQKRYYEKHGRSKRQTKRYPCGHVVCAAAKVERDFKRYWNKVQKSCGHVSCVSIGKVERSLSAIANGDTQTLVMLLTSDDYVTNGSIAERYGVTADTVSQWAKRLGLQRDNVEWCQRIHDEAVTQFIEEYSEDLADNKHRRLKARRRYRILSKPHEGGRITWQKIVRRNGGSMKCACCGKTCVPKSEDRNEWPTVGHIIAIANGGTDTYDNVQLECFECNVTKRDLGQTVLAWWS